MMRPWLTCLALALTLATAHAQVSGVDSAPGGQPFTARNQGPGKGQPPKIKADEKAYRDALKRLPNQPRDPWQGAR